MTVSDLASLSLFVATPEQLIESRQRTFLQWGSGMTLEQYLERDASLEKHEHAQHEGVVTW